MAQQRFVVMGVPGSVDVRSVKPQDRYQKLKRIIVNDPITGVCRFGISAGLADVARSVKLRPARWVSHEPFAGYRYCLLTIDPGHMPKHW